MPPKLVPADDLPSNLVPADDLPDQPSDPLVQAVRGQGSVREALAGPSGKILELPSRAEQRISPQTVLRGSIPLAVGLATVPLTGGMSVPAALAFEGLMQAGTEGFMQATGMNEPSAGQMVGAAVMPGTMRAVGAGAKGTAKLIAPHLAGAGASLRKFAGKTTQTLVDALEPEIKSTALYSKLADMNPQVPLGPIREAADKVAGGKSLLRAKPGEAAAVDPLSSVRSIADRLANLKGDPKHITEAYGSDAVNFQEVWSTMKDLNALIGSAKANRGADYNALMQLKHGFWEALESITKTGTGSAYKALKEANAAYRQEIAHETFDNIVFKNFKQALEGTDAYNSAAARAMNQLQKELREDEFLKAAFPKGAVDNIMATLDKIRQLPIRGAPAGADAGSKLIAQRSTVGGGLGMAIGGAIGGPIGATIGTGVGVAGSVAGSALMAKALQTQRGSEMLLKLIQSPGGFDYPKMAALGTFLRGLTAESAEVAKAVKATLSDKNVSLEDKLAITEETEKAKRDAERVPSFLKRHFERQSPNEL